MLEDVADFVFEVEGHSTLIDSETALLILSLSVQEEPYIFDQPVYLHELHFNLEHRVVS